MFIKGDLFDKLLCCRRKVVEEDEAERGVEQVVLQHTNNNQTEYITSAQLVEKLKGGTTAVVALVREKRLVVAWLGDSQALLVRRRTPVRMVEPHKPELPVERERVEEMGGCVLNIQGTWRVLGQLAVSRAIGDREYKPYVSSECDIKSLEIEGDEDFLILACDGLWDTLSPEAAVNLVYAYLTRNDGDTDGVGRCLVEAARNTGSDDNITAVVVFLRPVATIMEEEAQRIAQGQVPEPVPEAVLCKDSTPSSINAIFSPPVNHNNVEAPPAYNPFDPHSPQKMDTEDALTPASQLLQSQEEPMEGSEAPQLSARDSDSDEGLPAAGENHQAFNPHEAPTPTAEEVDAALAELDSIPDEVCEAGDIDEEDEEEEEWSYYRMDLQTQPQSDDVLVPGPPAKVVDSEAMDRDEGKAAPVLDLNKEPSLELKTEESSLQKNMEDVPSEGQPSPDLFQANMEGSAFSKEGSLMETSITDVGEYLDNEPSSPQVPGSPRSVEGFVTSVELNTPEEAGGVVHAQDVNGGGVDQSSGPFSVYVSSSPEPVSLDPHHHTSGDFGSVTEMTNGQIDGEVEQLEDSSPVEIVHAQSTVEVVASPTPMDKEADVLDVQTSPKVPVNPNVDLTFIPEPAVEPTAEKPVPVFIDEGTPVSEGEPEIPGIGEDVKTPEAPVEDLLSKDILGGSFPSEQPGTDEVSPMEYNAEPVEKALSPEVPLIPEAVSPVELLEQPLVCPPVEQPSDMLVEVAAPTFSSPSPVSPAPAESPKVASPLEEMAPDLTFTPADNLVPESPVPESLPVSGSPVVASPVPESPVMSPVVESSHVPELALSPVPTSPVMEPSPVPTSPVMEPSPVPTSPVMDSSPVPTSPVMEPLEAPTSPVVESSPVPTSPVMEPSPVPTSPVMEPSPVPMSPVVESSPVPEPVVPEASPVPASPVIEESPAPVPVESVMPVEKEPELLSVSPVEEPVSVPSVDTAMDEPPSQPATLLPEVESIPAVEPKAAEEVPPPVVCVETKTEKDEILINEGTVVIPVVSKDTKPEVTTTKSPVKTPKTAGKATADTTGKATPSRATPGKTPTSRTQSARTPLTKSTEKKTTPTTRQPLKSATTRPSAEKTATTTSTRPTSRTTAAASATSKPAATKPLTRPTSKTTTTTTRPPSTTASKPAEKKAPKPTTPTAPRSSLTKPSSAASKPAQPAPTSRTTTATRRPTTAPTKKVEKTDSIKENGTARKASPRPTSTRPTTASTATRKPATTKPVPEKETKNTTNRILSSTTRGATKTGTNITSRTTTAGQSAATKTTTKVEGRQSSATTATSRTKMMSTTRSTTATSKTTGVAAKRTVVSKTSTTTTTKTKAAAATAASTKGQKAEMITAPVANGENKIAHEETSVEVIEKCAAEDVIQQQSTTEQQQVITAETVEVIVNGDH